MTEVLYISDLLLEDLVGGGELNDYELCVALSKNGYKLKKLRSHQVKQSDLRTDVFYIISNFINLNPNVKNYIQNNCDYIIYEHDHKYLKSRNPAIYANYQTTKDYQKH